MVWKTRYNYWPYRNNNHNRLWKLYVKKLGNLDEMGKLQKDKTTETDSKINVNIWIKLQQRKLLNK